MYSALKMLETIITEAIFLFNLGLYYKHSRLTGQQQEKREGTSLTPLGDKLFWAKNLWEGYSKWDD